MANSPETGRPLTFDSNAGAVLYACALTLPRASECACSIVNVRACTCKAGVANERCEKKDMSHCLELAVTLFLIIAAQLLSTAVTLATPPPPSGWGCGPCNRTSCPPRGDCRRGLQLVDDCGCCTLCPGKKLEGERCGGEGNAGASCSGRVWSASTGSAASLERREWESARTVSDSG